MKYRYEDMSPGQFESLVVLLCGRLLGISVQGFAAGPDGGRDAKFVGTAERHPSKAKPWKGTTIVQAKHTNGCSRSCSETDFFSPKSANSIIGKELPKISKLREAKQLDHYMLFTNRRLTAIAESDIRKCISAAAALPEESIYLCGLEQLELLLRQFPEVPKLADLDPVDSPLVVSPDELATLIEALARQKAQVVSAMDIAPAPRVSYKTKNAINNMTDAYAVEQRRRYLKETAPIRAFLASPQNQDYLQLYSSVAEDFQLKILAKRKNHQTFDELMEYLLDLLFGRDPVLRQHGHRRLTRAMLFYMYWSCDIGESSNAATN